MKYRIQDALLLLKPGSEFSITNNDYSKLRWLDSGTTVPTITEVNNKIAELDAAEPMRLLREERDKRLSDSDWMAIGDRTQTDAQKTYRQALRDLPASASPKLDSNYNLDLTSVTWPTKPS